MLKVQHLMWLITDREIGGEKVAILELVDTYTH